jgi:hypothetical protein
MERQARRQMLLDRTTMSEINHAVFGLFLHFRHGESSVLHCL